MSLGGLKEAEKLAQESLQTLRDLHGATPHVKTADALTVLAMIRYIQGNYEASVPHYRESVTMLDELYGKMDPRGATNKLFFAFIVLESNLTGAESQEAERLINQVLEIRTSEADPPPQELAHAWLGKAIICRVRRKYVESMSALNEARAALHQDPRGANYVAIALDSVAAIVHWQTGQTEAAIEKSQEVIDASQRMLGRYHPVVTHLQLEMATRVIAANAEEHRKQGVDFMEEAVAACRVAYGRQPRTARALYRYGEQLFDRGQELEAEACLREAVEIYLETMGPKNVRTHRALRRHATILDKLGRAQATSDDRYFKKLASNQPVWHWLCQCLGT